MPGFDISRSVNSAARRERSPVWGPKLKDRRSVVWGLATEFPPVSPDTPGTLFLLTPLSLSFSSREPLVAKAEDWRLFRLWLADPCGYRSRCSLKSTTAGRVLGMFGFHHLAQATGRLIPKRLDTIRNTLMLLLLLLLFF